MLTTLTVAVMAAALVAGLFANHLRRRRHAAAGADDEEPSISDLISPLETLAVLLVAFVIVVAAESYGSAEAAVGAEAHRVDQLTTPSRSLWRRTTSVPSSARPGFPRRLRRSRAPSTGSW
ncbi:hypothetical protein [Streptomyces sp. NPDC006463]|uniref:hypothetical protein n=1 Tax=Streptomyces sp. NPDC006463 TaxID=3364746 RepID=UPI00367B2AF3